MRKIAVLLSIFTLQITFCSSQISDPSGLLKQKLENRANSKIDRALDKALDKTEEGVKNGSKKKDKKTNDSAGSNSDEKNLNSSNKKGSEPTNAAGASQEPSFKTYSKFDFVSGEKVIAFDDFANTNVGDFPADWNTNASAELVKIDSRPEKWFYMSQDGFFAPDYVTNMPENFTLEFDVFTRYKSNNMLSYGFYISAAENAKVELSNAYPSNGIHFAWNAASSAARYFVYENGTVVGSNESLVVPEFECGGDNYEKPSLVHISVWRQKTRLRIYVNEKKVLDLPKALDIKLKYNVFKLGSQYMNYSTSDNKDEFMVSNVRYAIGAPDTRSKLITEGKFVTRGIVFDLNSDKIKANSYGTIKEIATVLIENPLLKIKIVGHTDSDGDNAANLTLSQKRAESVKKTLASEFGIATDRMQTEGKGETEPSDDNNTPQGKANNRRVVFLKM